MKIQEDGDEKNINMKKKNAIEAEEAEEGRAREEERVR